MTISMDQLIDLLKQAALLLGVVAPGLKFLLGSRGSAKSLEDRYSRIERFFQGAHELPGLRMEAAFGAVLGHLKLSAIEIPLLLRQREPTQFIERYLQVRHYLGAKVDGESFVLRSAAARPVWRNTVRAVSFAFYILFAAVAGWLVIFGVPAGSSSFRVEARSQRRRVQAREVRGMAGAKGEAGRCTSLPRRRYEMAMKLAAVRNPRAARLACCMRPFMASTKAFDR